MSRFLFIQRFRLLKKLSFPREFVKFSVYIILPVCIFYAAGQPIIQKRMSTMILDDNFRREYAKLMRSYEGGDVERDIQTYEKRRKLHQERVDQYMESQIEQSRIKTKAAHHGEASLTDEERAQL